MASIRFWANLALMVGYLLMVDEKFAWPSRIIGWAWLPYVGYVYLHHFFDGVQNTTRNIARIYLLRNKGPQYDQRLIKPIQHALMPDRLFFLTILWQAAGVASFSCLLFLQGWAIALVAHGALFLFGGFLPIGYAAHLHRIQANLSGGLPASERVQLAMNGVSLAGLRDLVHTGIEERKNPQLWWGEVMSEISKEISSGTE